jgi:hypothetical protein
VSRRRRLRGRSLRRRGLHWRRLGAGQNGSVGVRAARSENREGDRGHHENNCGPGRRLGEHSGSGAGSKGGLAAHATEGSSDIATLAALQQHNDDEEGTDNDVDSGDQRNHVTFKSLSWRGALAAVESLNVAGNLQAGNGAEGGT